MSLSISSLSHIKCAIVRAEPQGTCLSPSPSHSFVLSLSLYQRVTASKAPTHCLSAALFDCLSLSWGEASALGLQRDMIYMWKNWYGTQSCFSLTWGEVNVLGFERDNIRSVRVCVYVCMYVKWKKCSCMCVCVSQCLCICACVYVCEAEEWMRERILLSRALTRRFSLSEKKKENFPLPTLSLRAQRHLFLHLIMCGTVRMESQGTCLSPRDSCLSLS